MKNGPCLFKFTNFSISLRLFQRKIIVFCDPKMILIIIAVIFHKLLKKLGCGWGELPSVCDHLAVILYVLGALRTIQQTLNSIYTEMLSSSR